MRRLQLTIAGRWFFGLLLMLAAVSLISSNNVVYLVESLLISALSISAYSAYFVGSVVSVDVRRKPLTARGTNRDQIRLTNRGRWRLFCVEVGEWREGRFHRLAFAPTVPPHSAVNLVSNQYSDSRGLHRWEGIAVACGYPFGFVKIVRVFPRPGERKIWPARLDPSRGVDPSGVELSPKYGNVPLTGEVRAMTQDDDYRSVVWTLSARGTDPVVRPRGAERSSPGVTLDLRQAAGDHFEQAVSRAASEFYGTDVESPSQGDMATLELIDWSGRHKIYGRRRALDELAVVQASGARGDRGGKVA